MATCKKIITHKGLMYSCTRSNGHSGRCKRSDRPIGASKPKRNNAAQDFSDKLNSYLAVQKNYLEARQQLEVAWDLMTSEKAPLSDFLDSLIKSFC